MIANAVNLHTERLWRELRAICRRRPDLAALVCCAGDTEGDPMLDNLPELLTLDETAELLRVSTRTVHEWIKIGRLPAVRLPGSRKVLVPREGVAAALQPYRDDPAATEGVKP